MYWNKFIKATNGEYTSWIVTLDVLKCVSAGDFLSGFCWIVTLDVLK